MPHKTLPPLYSIWQGMLRRCRTPTHKQWADYGGRGIRVCDEWTTYANFERDMLPRPPGGTLERLDVNGNYEPGNCVWATRKEQQRNQRRTIMVTFEGVTYKAIELSEKSGLKVDTIVKRASQGMTLAAAMQKRYYINPKNTRAAIAKRVANQLAKTHCKHGHPLTPENTGITASGWRYCRHCHRLKVARQQAAKKAKLTATPSQLESRGIGSP